MNYLFYKCTNNFFIKNTFYKFYKSIKIEIVV